MYKLLVEDARIRFYELKFNVQKGKYGDVKEPTNLIMISDAGTHAERLVFPIYLVEGFTIEDVIRGEKGCVSVDWGEIAGEMTMMIDGGDASTVRPDEEYIKELYELNKE